MQSQTAAMTAFSVLVSQVLSIGCCWLVSKLVTPETATLGNAALWWLLSLLLALVAFVPFLLVLGITAVFGGVGGVLFVALIVVVVVLSFLIPMRLYRIGVGRALVLMIAVGLLEFLLGLGLGQLHPASSQSDWKQFARLMQSKGIRAPSAPSPASSPPRPGVTEVTIVEPVRVPVLDDDGQVIGDIEIGEGTRVEFLGLMGNTVEIRYLDSVAKVPRKKTDY